MGSIVDLKSAVKTGYNLEIIIKLGFHHFFKFELMNYDFGFIEVSKTLTMKQLRREVSDQIYGFKPYKRILTNIILENKDGVSLHTAEITITPIAQPESDSDTFLWSTEISFQPIDRIFNPFMKNILTFSNYHNISDFKNSNPDS